MVISSWPQNGSCCVKHNHSSSPSPVARAGTLRLHQFLFAVVVIVMEPIQQTTATDPVVRIGARRKITAGEMLPTNYIVSFKDMEAPPAQRCAELAKSTGGTVQHIYDQVLNGCLLVSPAVQAQSAFTALVNNPIVKIVEQDQEVSIATQIIVREDNIFNSPSQGQGSAETASSWGLDRIDQCALPLDNVVTKQDATGVKVFIVDTGIYAEHDEFSNGVIGPDDCHFSAFPGESGLSDGHGHGTHVAGTTCGNQFGVSRNCQLCSVKVMNANGGGAVSDVIAGINHVVTKCSASGTLCVANVSLGSIGYNEIFNAAVASAVTKGVVVVVAAGNSNKDACSYSPASTIPAITVGATTTNDEKASFSNWGSCVDVYAPGSDIISAWNSSPTAASTLSGTSMATPHVAGIAAAIRSANPSWNPAQVRDSIVSSAAVIPSSGINLATVGDINCPRPPTSAPTPCSNGMDVEIKIMTDYFPAETAWTLTNKCGAGIVKNSPEYTQYATMHSTKMLCLPAGEYEFTITDKAGDGNCCKYGDGSYELIVDGGIVRSGGVFGYLESTTFGECIAKTLETSNPTLPTTETPTSRAPTVSPTSASPTTATPTTVSPTSASPTTATPTFFPTTVSPTPFPTTASPTTTSPTFRPTTISPTLKLTRPPTRIPTRSPTPTRVPTRSPTQSPTATRVPTRSPVTRNPTRIPTRKPTQIPNALPTRKPCGT